MSLSTPEKKALVGMTLILAFVGFSIYEIGIRNFWFEAKNTYHTHVADADGLRIGSVVTIAGLRVGEVSGLEVDEESRIAVAVTIRRTVAARLRTDSVATVSRAFIIGEKRIELVPGSPSERQLPDGATLPGKDAVDLADFLSGRKLAELMNQVESLISGINATLKETETMLAKYHSGAFDKTFSMVEPALKNFLRLSDDMLVMTKEMKTKSKQLPVFVESGAQVLTGVRDDLVTNKLMRDSFDKVNRTLTPLAERQQLIASVLGNLQDLSHDLHSDPQFGRQVLDAVHELDVTLRALQKTWFLEDQSEAAKADVTKARLVPPGGQAPRAAPPPPTE